MRKSFKWIVVGLVVLVCVVGGVYYVMMPLPVRMTEVRLGDAELSFVEQGVVSGEGLVMVFPLAQGEINGLYVREGQLVRAGDVLVSVDYSGLRLQLEQVLSGIRGLEAQLANVDVEDAHLRQGLESARLSLQGELQSINAQARQTDRAFADHTEALNEQLRIQQVLIDQHENELGRVLDNFARVREDYRRIESLYQNGVASRAELDTADSAVAAAQGAVDAAQSQIDTAQGQLALIATGTGQSATEHFEGIRSSINAQISGINQQLAADTTTATRAHFAALIEVEETRAAQIRREIENTTLVAPVDGIITSLHAERTNFISAAAPVAEITVPGNLAIDVYVSTQDVASIELGDVVSLTLRRRTGDAHFSGRVVEIDSAAVVRFTALGVEERKVSVRIEPDIPADVQLGVGYAVDASFYVFREENRITVPRTAIFRVDGQDMVWLAGGQSGNGEARAVPVTTGLELRTDIIIESGLSAGDFIINDANNQDLSEGRRVVNER